MKTLVAYYSRDGSTRKVAQSLAHEISAADIEELGAVERYEGFLGYFKAGYDSWKGRLPAIAPVRCSPAAYDFVVIGAPLWAGHAATPIRSYLKDHQGEFKRTAVFVTHGGSSPVRALKEISELAGQTPVAKMSVRTKAISDGTFLADLRNFISELNLQKAP